jgi:hypothetical protein
MKASETTLNQDCVAVLDSTANDSVKRPTAAAAVADRVAGVLLDATLAALGEGAFQTHGYSYGIAYAAITVGDRLVIADTAGRLRKAVFASDAGADLVGVAQESVTTQGSRFVLLLTPGQVICS